MSTAIDAPTVAAVIDIDAYARSAVPSDDWFARRAAPAFSDESATVTALAPRGEGRVEALATDECVLLLAGRLEIESGGEPIVLGPRTAAALPLGSSFTWRASDDALAIVYVAPAATAGHPDRPVPIDQQAPLTPSAAPLPENLIGPTPSCRNHTDYLSNNREFVCGVWDSTAYHRRQIPYRQVELMHLLDGEVSFTAGDARVTFSAGDTCLFVRGEGCAWISEEYVRKIYATQRPVA